MLLSTTPRIFGAIALGNVSSVKKILELCEDNKKEVNQRWECCYPLIEAAARGHYEIVQILVEAGANVNVQSRKQTTALHHLCEKSDVPIECLEAIASAGANPNVKGYPGEYTPLHACVRKRELTTRVEVVQALLHMGADVNATDAKGKTPCVLWGRAAIVTELVRRGADISLRDNENYTPTETAIERLTHERDCKDAEDLKGIVNYLQTELHHQQRRLLAPTEMIVFLMCVKREGKVHLPEEMKKFIFSFLYS